jgi:hypothetical protein
MEIDKLKLEIEDMALALMTYKPKIEWDVTADYTLIEVEKWLIDIHSNGYVWVTHAGEQVTLGEAKTAIWNLIK